MSHTRHHNRLSRSLYLGAGIVFLSALGLFITFGVYRIFFSHSPNTPAISGHSNNQSAQSGPCQYQRVLDGVCVQSATAVNPRVVAVMVENSRDAWPLSGLAAASVVYEAPVEANIPRFVALFPSDESVAEVGPVRSSRPYYIDWIEEYGDPLYMHVGGSSEALDTIDTRNIFDMNEMHRGWYFWRSEDRSAPHNTYTSNKLWQKAIESYGKDWPQASFDPWTFGVAPACSTNCTTRTHVSFSSAASYEVDWNYSSSTDAYTREQAGKVDTDRDGAVRVADTVIIQRVHATVLDDVGRQHIDTIGSGDVTMLAHGQAVVGTWKKTSAESRTQWLDQSGNPIPLKSGKIWIEVVPESGRVTLGETRN